MSNGDLFGEGDYVSKALISPCGNYRYALMRYWDQALPPLMWVMLNPSTADGEQDDATIKACIAIAKNLGYGGINVCNLFAWRSTDRSVLKKVEDPIGPDNDGWLKLHAAISDMVLCGWGTDGALYSRASMVKTLLWDKDLYCMQRTKDGHPQHPLYVKRDKKPVLLRARL